jgi:hypothetical protein
MVHSVLHPFSHEQQQHQWMQLKMNHHSITHVLGISNSVHFPDWRGCFSETVHRFTVRGALAPEILAAFSPQFRLPYLFESVVA